MFLYSVMWSYSSIRKTKREYFFGFMMYASQKQLVVRVILVLHIFYVKKVCSISRLPLRSVCLMAVVVGGEVFFSSGNLAIFGMICFVSFCFFRETFAIPCVGLRERFLLSWGWVSSCHCCDRFRPRSYILVVLVRHCDVKSRGGCSFGLFEWQLPIG